MKEVKEVKGPPIIGVWEKLGDIPPLYVRPRVYVDNSKILHSPHSLHWRLRTRDRDMIAAQNLARAFLTVLPPPSANERGHVTSPEPARENHAPGHVTRARNLVSGCAGASNGADLPADAACQRRYRFF